MVVRKVYRVIPDPAAKAKDLLRVVNESGEDYLFPADFFVPVSISKHNKDVIARAS